MDTKTLKQNIKKIMTSEFKDSEKKAGIKLLIGEYSEQSSMHPSIAKDYIEGLVQKGIEKGDWGV